MSRPIVVEGPPVGDRSYAHVRVACRAARRRGGRRRGVAVVVADRGAHSLQRSGGGIIIAMEERYACPEEPGATPSRKARLALTPSISYARTAHNGRNASGGERSWPPHIHRGALHKQSTRSVLAPHSQQCIRSCRNGSSDSSRAQVVESVSDRVTAARKSSVRCFSPATWSTLTAPPSTTANAGEKRTHDSRPPLRRADQRTNRSRRGYGWRPRVGCR